MGHRRYLTAGRDGIDGSNPTSEPKSADALLDGLGERIFLAPSGAEDGVAHETSWDDRSAARFALECVAHALGDEKGATLPNGKTLDSVLEEVRAELDRTGSGPDGSLGMLSSIAAVRRLKRAGAKVSDLAFAVARDDLAHEVELLDDPSWTALAAIGEAILASVEALRFVARPRHVARREATEERNEQEESSPARIQETPWGPIVIGGEHIASDVPACLAAQEAAERARQSVLDRFGPDGAAAERAWQGELLESLLSGTALG